MHDTLPLLEKIPFPAIRRGRLDTLQVNVGYRCNQSCVHCHVGASPHRTEEMTRRGRRPGAGVPRAAAHRHARHHRRRAGAQSAFPPPGDRGARHGRAGDGPLQPHHPRGRGPGGPAGIPRRASRSRSSPRCPAISRTTSTASAARACSTARSAALQRLNALGYGRDGSGLMLNLVYNPQGPSLPPPQAALEADYKRMLGEQHGVVFNRLYTLANMPIQRFGSTLISKGEFDSYLDAAAARAPRRQPRRRDVPQPHLGRLARLRLRLRLQPDARPADDARRGARACICPTCSTTTSTDNPIRVAGHCFGCTAGQGSSCGGALKEAAE